MAVSLAAPGVARPARDDLVEVKALEHRLAALIGDRSGEAAEAPPALLPHAIHGEARVDRVAHRHGLEEAAPLLHEHEAVQVWACRGGAERGHRGEQEAVGERLAEARG